jgi:hypothetical protein
VTGDGQARICEGLGVKFPGATRRVRSTGVPTATRKTIMARWCRLSLARMARHTHEDPGQFQCLRGETCKVIGCVDVVFLGALVGKGIANAAIAPTNAPKMANSTFCVVYENAIPKMLIVRREPAAKACFVTKSDRTRLGTTMPAMNKVNTTSISSRTNEEAFCLFMLFPFSLGRLFQEGILLGSALTVGHIRLRKQRPSRALSGTPSAYARSVPVINSPLP